MSDIPTAATPIDKRISDLEREVSAAAMELERSDLVDRLVVIEQAGKPITLVVAGETSGGKSSLINALIDRPDLLAIGADVTTSIYVTVQAGEDAAVIRTASGAVKDIGLGDLHDWTSVDGGDHVQPAAMAEVSVASPSLPNGLVIIDTPGVGGLDAGHAEMTLLALREADALLFVLDALAPISAPERRFLERASERIETVIFALTKIDLFTGWETIRNQDRELLAAFVPRFADAPIVPVSSVLADKAKVAEAAGRHAAAEEFRTNSGLDVLHTLIEEQVMVPGARLRRTNRVRGAISVVDELRTTVRARAAAAAGDVRQQADLEAARTRVEQYRSAAGNWSVTIADEFSVLGGNLRRILTVETLNIENDLSTVIDPEQVSALAKELEVRLADCLIRLNAAMGQGVTDVAERLTEILSLEGIEVRSATIGGLPNAVMLDSPVSTESDAETAVGIGRMILSATGPVMFLNMVQLGPLMPFGLVLGLAMGFVDRQRITRTSHLNAAQKQWMTCLRQTVGLARVNTTAELDQHLLAVRRQIEGEVRAAVDRRLAVLRKESTHLTALANESKQERDRVITAAQLTEGRLDNVAARGAQVAQSIDVAVDDRSQPEGAPGSAQPVAASSEGVVRA